MLLTSRPDNQPTLGGHPHVTRLTLNRLGRGPTEAIVARLTGGRSLPPQVLGEIAARTDGVPLFIEELTKAVLEAGTTGPGPAAVPASLHASLMARLDRVPGVKEVAQVAACIGREFTYPLLAAVSPLPEAELQAALDRLAAAELVFSRGTPPEASYAFKHALVRDAAHESLLKAQRQQLHARIARVLEERFPETVDGRARAARPALHRGGARRAGGRLLAAGRAAGARALRDGRGGRAPDQGAGGAEGPARRARASAARARPAARAGPGIDRREGLRGAGDGSRLRPGARAVPRAGRCPGALPGPVRAIRRATSSVASWPRRTRSRGSCCAWPRSGATPPRR